MLWQDIIFMLGSGFSVFVLMPTLRDSTARIPWGTSLPSVGIGLVYASTFYSLGMILSAVGAIAAATMWSLIAAFRNPDGRPPRLAAVGSRVATTVTDH